MHQHNHTKAKTLKLWNYYSASEKKNAAAYKHVLEKVFLTVAQNGCTMFKQQFFDVL